MGQRFMLRALKRDPCREVRHTGVGRERSQSTVGLQLRLQPVLQRALELGQPSDLPPN